MAVVKANYVKRGASERKIAKGNLSYIQNRPGRDKEQLTRMLFGAAGSMGRYEAYQFINEAPKGTLFYRLKLSPDPAGEDTKRDLHMQKLTRQMMQSLEKRLNTAIPWAAALHDDHTDIRHVHILAALPRTLHTYELAFLIKAATRICAQQRRSLDRGMSRLPWLTPPSQQPLKTGKYPTLTSLSAGSLAGSFANRHSLSHPLPQWGISPKSAQPSCICPRCHFPQTHDRRGMHSCPSCGLMLHKKKAPTLQRRKGVGWERSR